MPTTTDPDLLEAVSHIEEKRAEYESTIKAKKYEYLAAVRDAKERFGTTVISRGMGVTRHRIYQILNECRDLGEELGR